MAATNRSASTTSAGKTSSVSDGYSKQNFLLGGKLLSFTDNAELMKFAMAQIQKANDPDDLICSSSMTLTRNSLKTESGKHTFC